MLFVWFVVQQKKIQHNPLGYMCTHADSVCVCACVCLCLSFAYLLLCYCWVFDFTSSAVCGRTLAENRPQEIIDLLADAPFATDRAREFDCSEYLHYKGTSHAKSRCDIIRYCLCVRAEFAADKNQNAFTPKKTNQ